ncbi:MAG: hypothetical protein ACRBCK_03410 [Alphaproteobacteria bacterium]
MSDIIKNKPSAARIAFTERVKRFSYGTAAFLAIASTGVVDEESELTHEGNEQSHVRYLENQGCDGNMYLRGDIPFCPDTQDEAEVTKHSPNKTLEEEHEGENIGVELTAP